MYRLRFPCLFAVRRLLPPARADLACFWPHTTIQRSKQRDLENPRQRLLIRNHSKIISEKASARLNGNERCTDDLLQEVDPLNYPRILVITQPLPLWD